jgi:Fe-S-cluster-containing hydrogenase component 2
MIETDEKVCLRCSGCVGVCPKSALTLREHGIECSEACINCRLCFIFCPVGAIRMVDK